MKKGPLEVGQEVFARYLEQWGGWTSDWWKGVVRLVNEDDTAAIDFDDGDTAERVPLRYAFRLEEEQALLPSPLKETLSRRQPMPRERHDASTLGGGLQYPRKRSSQTVDPLASSPKPKRRRKMPSSPSSVQVRLDHEEEEEEEEEEEGAETQGQMDPVSESKPPSVRLLLRKPPPSGPAKPAEPAEPEEPEESQARLELWREEQRLWREKGDRRRKQEAEEQARQEMERTDWLSSINGSWLRAMQSDQFDGNPDHAHEFDGNPNPRRNKCCDEWQWGLTLPLAFGRSPSELIEDNEDSDDGVEEEEE